MDFIWLTRIIRDAMLASLFNIPSNKEQINEFSFANKDHHTQIAQALQRLYAVTLPVYLIDPIPLFSPGVWLYNHQAMHDAQNAVLGIQGNDFTDLDFDKPDQLSNWIWLHANEHAQAAKLLGI